MGDGSPVKAVAERLAEYGYRGGRAAVAEGLAAEYPYYRAHHKFAVNQGQLSDLHRRCGQMVIDSMGAKGAMLDPLLVGEAIAESFPPRLYPETTAALIRARAMGLRVGVLSNFSFKLIDWLNFLGIEEMIDFVVCSALVGVAKPDLAIFELARAQANCRVDRIAHLGNSYPEDYQGASAAGFFAVLIDRDGATGKERYKKEPIVAADLLAALELLEVSR